VTDSDADSGSAFKEVHSKKRKKTNSGHTVAPTDVPTDSYSSKVKMVKKTTKPTKLKVVGKKVFSDDSRFKASGLEIDKAVYCISNLSLDITDEDVVAFMSGNDIKVISCFSAKTRFTGSKAFRVCIAAKDKERFLSPDNWPEKVIIRDWVFKPRTAIKSTAIAATETTSTAAAVGVV